MDVVQEILCDLADGNIIDIQLVPLNKEKEQVERAFELGKFYFVAVIAHGIDYLLIMNTIQA